MHYTTQETSTVFGQISDSSNKFSSLGSQSYKQSTCKMTSTSSTFPFFSTYAEATNVSHFIVYSKVTLTIGVHSWQPVSQKMLQKFSRIRFQPHPVVFPLGGNDTRAPCREIDQM
jgi:hypothetical protein